VVGTVVAEGSGTLVEGADVLGTVVVAGVDVSGAVLGRAPRERATGRAPIADSLLGSGVVVLGGTDVLIVAVVELGTDEPGTVEPGTVEPGGTLSPGSVVVGAPLKSPV
jgi:hypothetical protein